MTAPRAIEEIGYALRKHAQRNQQMYAVNDLIGPVRLDAIAFISFVAAT